ncbi:UNVERIFIED_CONTAM: hypothetical protein K2H54_045510 [Gekko kuhli]
MSFSDMAENQRGIPAESPDLLTKAWVHVPCSSAAPREEVLEDLATMAISSSTHSATTEDGGPSGGHGDTSSNAGSSSSPCP